MTSLDKLAEYRTILDKSERDKPDWEVLCDGEQWHIAKQ